MVIGPDKRIRTYCKGFFFLCGFEFVCDFPSCISKADLYTLGNSFVKKTYCVINLFVIAFGTIININLRMKNFSLIFTGEAFDFLN